MRRDVCHYYEADLKSVYNAYAKAATEKFGKDCEYHNEYKMSFGLEFTFKYNMNGGVCVIHFMPYRTGTAVNVRYSIAQLVGARYTAYDHELTGHVVSLLGVASVGITGDAEQFERYAEQMTANKDAQRAAPQPAPQAPQAPRVAPQPAPQAPQAPRVAPQPAPQAPQAQRVAPQPEPQAPQAPRVAPQPARSNSAQTTPYSFADDLRKYKELLDEGIITQEEFEAKKKQILSLL